MSCLQMLWRRSGQMQALGIFIVCLVILMRFSVLNGGAFCIKILENQIQAGQLISRTISYIKHTQQSSGIGIHGIIQRALPLLCKIHSFRGGNIHFNTIKLMKVKKFQQTKKTQTRGIKKNIIMCWDASYSPTPWRAAPPGYPSYAETGFSRSRET